MSHYVMSDIHGCYDEFIKMLKLIDFNDDEDTLILLGDYIDRGPKSYEMVEWLKSHVRNNIITLRGNHEEEFIANIDLLNQIDTDKPLLEVCELLHSKSEYFDTYGTIRQLIREKQMNLGDLNEWRELFAQMKYTKMLHIRHCKRTLIFVHAGYITSVDGLPYKNREEFFLYARGDDAFTKGGTPRSVIVSGHTPTIIKEDPTYNNGHVCRIRNKETGCRYIDIDCGCAFKDKYPNAHLACVKFDEDKVTDYYI